MLVSRPFLALGAVLCGACLLGAACGKSSALSSHGTGGATTIASGGTTDVATSGFGGSTLPSTGVATGGSAGADAGTSGVGTGGTTVLGAGGNGGAGGGDGSPDSLSCTAVTCPSLPSSCKKIVQDPNACCPVCTDTGCPQCSEVKCAVGTHPETLAGACCPTCVADPLDACTQGRQSYAALRTQMLDKYGSTKCKNSLDCTLLLESNACGTLCNVALPTTMIKNYQDNLANSATNNCSTCPPPEPASCELMVPACVNEKCMAAAPS